MSDELRSPDLAPPRPAAAALEQLRVLVVEDSASDRRLVLEALVEAGVPRDEVVCAGSLREARVALLQAPVGCVLLDMTLPDATGLEGVALLSAAAPDTPVVVITGHPGGSMVYAAMAEGADEYLAKGDLDPQRLADAVNRAVQRRRGADRHRTALASAAAVFDSIRSSIAVVDGSGRIIAVNDAWTQFSAAGGGDPTRTGVGVNYLAVCDRAQGRGAEGATAIASGIRAVLAGDLPSFSMDYPCPSPTEDRWFSVRVSPSGEVGGGAVLIHLDVTELKAVERGALAHARLFDALDATSPIFALVGADSTVIHVSELTRAVLGLQPGDRVGEDISTHIEPGDRAAAMELLARVAAVPGAREELRMRALDGDGRWRDLDLTVTNLLHDPRVGALAVTGSDVTESRLHQIARRLESRLLDGLPVAVGLTDDSGILVYWNDAAEALYRLPRDGAIGRNVADLGVQSPDPALHAAIAASVATHGRWEGDAMGRRADGEPVPVHVLLERIDDDEIDFHGTVYASFDNTDRHRLEAELEFQALHDPLTGLPNRRRFLERLDEVLAGHATRNRSAAVTFIDLDDFKALNDRVGHGAGDHALRVIAERLLRSLRPGDLVARIGGDEFVVGFADLRGQDEAVAIAERLLRSLREPFRLGHHNVAMSATIGIAMSQPDVPADTLLRNADAAMYEAKSAGKNRVGVFDDELQQRAREQRELVELLELGLRTGEVRAYLQPQYSLATGELVGFEALARWERDGVVHDSAEFIELAEESGIVDQIDRLVLTEACAALAALHELAPEGTPTVSVNASAQQVVDPCFAALVGELVAGHDFPAELLCIEVVEKALADEDAALATLDALQRMGVALAIDDFGTGYSSLSRLQQFHVDYLKIDRTFVGRMDASDDEAVVSAVIGLAQALDLRTVAEGVETEAQRRRLHELGVDFGQGYLWSPAVPVPDALAAFEAHTGPAETAPRSGRSSATTPSSP